MTERLILGDCLEVLPTLPDSSIDFILTDLPYGTTQNKWDTVIPLPEMWAEFWRVLKPDGCIALTAQTPFSEALGFSQLKYLRYKWLWIKSRVTGFLNSKKAPLKKTEDILIFYKKPPLYNPQFSVGKPYKSIIKHQSSNYGNMQGCEIINSGFRYPTDVLEFNSETGLHPTQKPVELFRYLIRTYTNEGDTVLDICSGSGTTALACVLEKRGFICIEKDEKYFEIMENRILETLL